MKDKSNDRRDRWGVVDIIHNSSDLPQLLSDTVVWS